MELGGADIMTDRRPQIVSLDTILPADMAARAENTGVLRAAMDTPSILVLSVLAGAFISFGAIFATTVGAGAINISQAGGAAGQATLPYGLVRLLMGLTFSLGLLMVVIAGAELFTGNNMIVMAWANGKVRTAALLRNWVLCYCGNCIGAIATAALMFFTTQYSFGGGAVGLAALSAAHAKVSLGFVAAFSLGIMCNALVCLAVWMCHAARTSVDRVVTLIPPVAAFVASGFEHSIANVYFIPVALFIKAGAPETFWQTVGRTPADFPNLTWSNFLENLLPVTLGNIVGGSVMVAAVYWFVYLRTGQRT
jgi:formate transporter